MQLTILESTRERTSMSFSRHEEIYRSDVKLGKPWERQLRSPLPALIGCDEFPVGYSLGRLPSGRACLRFTDCKRFSTTHVAVQ